jgi:hypothetical protein
MARGGFLGRIARAIKKVVAPSPRRPPAPPPGREPPRERGPRGGPFREVWRDNNGKGSYRKNLEVFHRVVDPIEKDPDEQLELWESFVKNIVNPRGRERRQSTDNMFWRDSGIDPRDFRWQEWREAMGYTGKRRSRTP